MNALLAKAISELKKLPEAEQAAIAREALERIEAHARWKKLLADPRFEGVLKRLAAEALKRSAVAVLSKEILPTGGFGNSSRLACRRAGAGSKRLLAVSLRPCLPRAPL